MFSKASAYLTKWLASEKESVLSYKLCSIIFFLYDFNGFVSLGKRDEIYIITIYYHYNLITLKFTIVSYNRLTLEHACACASAWKNLSNPRGPRAALISADTFFLALITRFTLARAAASTCALSRVRIFIEIRCDAWVGQVLFPLQFAATRPRTLRARGKGETGESTGCHARTWNSLTLTAPAAHVA